MRDIVAVEHALNLRAEVLEASTARLKTKLGVDEKRAFRLAATDLFVEKAQRVLTRRAHALYASGFVTALAAIAMLSGAIWVAYSRSTALALDHTLSTQVVVLAIFQTLALGAFIYVTVKLFISLARSFFHEALNLYERRHALRFGRMWTYVSDEETSDLDELTAAFEWNRSSTTSFLDIDASKVTRTLFHEIADGLAKVPEKTADAVVEVVKKTPKTGVS